jgi:hypothetical protein
MIALPNPGAESAFAVENVPLAAAAANRRARYSISPISILVALVFAGPLTLLAVDFWEQVACKRFEVLCRAKIINWTRESTYERGPEDAGESLRFFFRSTTKKEEI